MIGSITSPATKLLLIWLHFVDKYLYSLNLLWNFPRLFVTRLKSKMICGVVWNVFQDMWSMAGEWGSYFTAWLHTKMGRHQINLGKDNDVLRQHTCIIGHIANILPMFGWLLVDFQPTSLGKFSEVWTEKWIIVALLWLNMTSLFKLRWSCLLYQQAVTLLLTDTLPKT